MSGTTQRATVPADFGTGPRAVAARWIAEVRLAERDEHQWVQRARKVEKRYLDERGSTQRHDTRFNVFWSNVQTLKPAIYAKPPKPVVQRRYLDQDPVGRAASTILQRAIGVSIEQSSWHECTDQAVMDYLLPGRGVCWIRYEPHFRDVQAGAVQGSEAAEVGEGAPPDMGGVPVAEPDGANGPDDDGLQVTDTAENQQEITYEEACWDYVNWRDFCHSPARTWQEVRWVARRVLLTQEEGVDRFGAMFKDVPMTWRPDGMDEEDSAYQLFTRARVYEIWDKPSRKVIWLCPDYGDAPLDEKDDPLKLDGFFPCPRPLYATITSSSLMPRPDYTMYQDQAEELDNLTTRIERLSRAIKAVGVYDASADGVQRLFNEGVDNELLPVQQWAAFTTGGGFKGAIDMLPLDTMAQALAQLVEVREQTKRDLYEITGISDIVRGQGMASATATAERIKGQFAQLRLRDRVNEVARFCRDMVRMTGEVICKHFQPETLLLMSDYQNSTGATPKMAQQAIALLKNDQIRGFRIDIEVDSTVIADQQEEQDARVAFLQMAGMFLKEAVPLSMQVPALANLAGQMLLFGVRGFPVGREMEAVFETALEQLQQAQSKPKPEPPPDPAMMEVQAKQQEAQARLQLEAQGQDAELQLKARDMQARQALEAAKLQLEEMRLQLDEQKIGLEARRADDDRMRGERDHMLKVTTADTDRREKDAMTKEQSVADVQSALAQIAEQIAAMGEQQKFTMATMAQPRRVRLVRGPDGKVTEAMQIPTGGE